MNDKVRVILVEDHKMVREGLGSLLDREGSGIEVVGEAENGQQALELTRNTEFDVLVCDVTMPVMGGIELLENLKKEGRLPKTLMLSMHEGGNIVESAFSAGALGYVTKNAEYDFLVYAVHGVAKGMRLSSVSTNTPKNDGGAVLSEREKEIVGLIGNGLSNSEISRQLHISAKTVSSHKTNILTKLGLRNEMELMKWILLERKEA